MYDVTSSYLEGTENELADYGYNRDGKKGKKQIVAGLLCDDAGVPLSIELFKGNTNDIKTLGSQIHKVAQRFKCGQVTFVGDKGMIKQAGIESLQTEGFHYITTITKPQIEHLIQEGVLQLSLFDDQLGEVTNEGIRYVFRRNPQRAKEIAKCRLEKQVSIERFITKKNSYLAVHPLATEATAQREIMHKITSHRLESWLSVEVVDRKFRLKHDETGLTEMSKLDGCYVMKTDLPGTVDKQIIHDRYKGLAEVESAFRTCKTGLLELRPIYTITKESTRGHAFIVMLAYRIIQHLRQTWRTFDMTVEEGIDLLGKISLCEIWINHVYTASQIALPNAEVKQLLDTLGIVMPQTLPLSGVKIVTRKKLHKERNIG